MNARQSLAAVVALVLGIGIGAVLNRPTVAQQQPNGPAVGRYQVAVGGSPSHIMVIDTLTCQCWTWAKSDGEWSDLGTPTAQKRKTAGE